MVRRRSLIDADARREHPYRIMYSTMARAYCDAQKGHRNTHVGRRREANVRIYYIVWFIDDDVWVLGQQRECPLL